jgi:uncharacterized membrane protein YedE/YeeE
MGPLVENGLILPWMTIILGFVSGIFFGWTLESAGLADARKISGVFYLKDFTVPKVMFTAIITALVGVYYMNILGLLDIGKLEFSATLVWPFIIGGIVFGMGMVTSGYCPGTTLAAAATGKIDGFMVIAGIFIGAALHTLTRPLFEAVVYSGNLGFITLPELVGIAPGFVIAGVVAMALGSFWAIEIAEKRMNPRATDAPQDES